MTYDTNPISLQDQLKVFNMAQNHDVFLELKFGI